MTRWSATYHFRIQFGDGWKASKQKLYLSLHGDEGDKPSEQLVDELLPEQTVTPGRLSYGRFREAPRVGNLERGRILVEGLSVVIKWMTIKGDGAVWIADQIGEVSGAKDIAFRIDSEESNSPNNLRKSIAEDARLKTEDPEAWVTKRRRQNELIGSITGIQFDDPEEQLRTEAAKSGQKLRANPDAQDPTRARAMGDPLPEAELDAYRKRGLTDEQIFQVVRKGRSLPQQQGRPLQSMKPNYGSDYEGFSLASAPVVKLAEEDQTEEV